MQAFAIVHPIVELDSAIIIEFIDETEPEDSRRYRMYLEKHTLREDKLIVYRPNVEVWQDITSMLSPYYLAGLRNLLVAQQPLAFEGYQDEIS